MLIAASLRRFAAALCLAKVSLWLSMCVLMGAGVMGTVPGPARVDLSPGESGWSLHWDSVPGRYYAVEKSHGLADWSLLGAVIRAEDDITGKQLPAESGSSVFYRVRSNAFIDPTTPEGAQPNLNHPTGDTWVLEFSDEFTFFNPGKWNITVSTSTRAPRWDKGIHRWFWVRENVSVGDGNLVFKVTKPNSTTMHCASVDTKDIYEPLYGFMEARMRIAPVVNAIHTAFWTQGHNMGNVDNSGADGAEVDIVETPWADARAQTVLHWDGYGSDKKSKTNRWSAPGLHTGYHTFAMHWTDSFIDIYYDGVFKWRYVGEGVPQVREWLWLSVGASFGDGDFQNGTYPSYAYVDYVRVWRSK